MKKLAIAFFASISLGAFSQIPDHSVKLNTGESFTKISYKQIIDSVNLNQTGPEQFEYLEIDLTQEEFNQVDNFMKGCSSIQPIINKFGSPVFDMTVGSNSNIIRPISGFYYSVENIKRANDSKLRICVIYPRIGNI
jgi:hypothetical protein